MPFLAHIALSFSCQYPLCFFLYINCLLPLKCKLQESSDLDIFTGIPGTKNSPFLPRPYQTLCPLVSLRAILRLLDTSRCGWCNSKCQILAPGPLLSSGPRPQLLSIQPPTECSQEKGAQAQGCLNPGRVGRCFEIVEAVQSDQELPAPSEALDTHF